MGSLEIATKANAALILPSLMLAGHLEHSALLSSVAKNFIEGDALAGKKSAQLKLTDGKIFTDHAIVQYFSELAIANETPQKAASVRSYSCLLELEKSPG